jgi:hypothetical protein
MLHKNTLGIVDCNLPFANFIGYDTVNEFMEEKSNFTDLITPNGVAMSKRCLFLFIYLLFMFIIFNFSNKPLELTNNFLIRPSSSLNGWS